MTGLTGLAILACALVILAWPTRTVPASATSRAMPASAELEPDHLR